MILQRRTERRTAERERREREELEYYSESRIHLRIAQRLVKREHLKWQWRAGQRKIRAEDKVWRRAAEERTRIEEERQEERRHRAAHHRWLC